MVEQLCISTVICLKLWIPDFQVNHDVLIEFMIFCNKFQKEKNDIDYGWKLVTFYDFFAITRNHLVIHKSNLIASGLFMKSIYLSRLENVVDIGIIGYVLSRWVGEYNLPRQNSNMYLKWGNENPQKNA